jgi:hypothetical protein
MENPGVVRTQLTGSWYLAVGLLEESGLSLTQMDGGEPSEWSVIASTA